MSKYSYELFRGELLGANMQVALQALTFAKEAHEGVYRKDGVTPYIEHPMKVASILYDLGAGEYVIAAAILHDVIEDCEDNDLKDKVYTTINRPILKIVKAVTKSPGYDNDIYYGKIKESAEAVLVKLADRYHNLSTLYNFTEEKKAKYIKETEHYIYPLIKYAENHYYEYSNIIRNLDLAIEAIINNVKPYIKE